uniref:exosortase-associated protein EpsI, V-type n=1 Tax=Altererythrobacter segetis TaxID=1104773 RepID=UPI00140DCCBC|nr:exosortase-associated protein EpsI, V-type [Altererythrobacter segetis]
MTDENAKSVQMLSRRHLVIGGALAAASCVAFARQPRVDRPLIKSSTFERWVPVNFDGWSLAGSSGVVLPPPDSLSARLYDNLVTRVYSAPAGDVMMLIAYNNRQDGVLQVHRPEVCYPTGGFVLTETKRIAISALGRPIPSNVFTAANADRTEQVIYFTRLGHHYPRSWAEQRIAVIEENLAGRIPDGVLLRVSVLSTDRDAAVDMLRQFVKGFAAAANPSLQKLLIV